MKVRPEFGRGRRVWILVMTCLGMEACAGPRQVIHRESTRPTRPTWTTKVPQRFGRVYVVGVSANQPDIALARRAARADASTAAAAVLSTTVKSEMRQRDSTRAQDELTERRIQSKVRGWVSGLIFEDEHVEHVRREVGRVVEHEYTIFVLGRIDMESLRRSKAQQVAQDRALVSSLEDQADSIERNFRNGRLFVAWEELHSALTELEEAFLGTSANDQVYRLETRLRQIKTRLEKNAKCLEVVSRGELSLSRASVRALETMIPAPLVVCGSGHKARFRMEVSLRVLSRGTLYGQQSLSVLFEISVRDVWQDRVQIIRRQGQVRGFGKGFAEAAVDVSRRVVKAFDQNSWAPVHQRISLAQPTSEK